jgi:hypothetical protein
VEEVDSLDEESKNYISSTKNKSNYTTGKSNTQDVSSSGFGLKR